MELVAGEKGVLIGREAFKLRLLSQRTHKLAYWPLSTLWVPSTPSLQVSILRQRKATEASCGD